MNTENTAVLRELGVKVRGTEDTEKLVLIAA